MAGIIGFVAVLGCVQDIDLSRESLAPEMVDTLREATVLCTGSDGQGFYHGREVLLSLAEVEGKPVEIHAANAYWVMQQAALKEGVHIRIVEAFRTPERQQYLYDCYLTNRCNGGQVAAKPGFSPHQTGHAFDLNTYDPKVKDWMLKNAVTYGFIQTEQDEPWHWEWWDGGPGGEICPVSTYGGPCSMLDGGAGICLKETYCDAKDGHFDKGQCPGLDASIRCCVVHVPCNVGSTSGYCSIDSGSDAKYCPTENGKELIPGHCLGATWGGTPNHYQCCVDKADAAPPDSGPEDTGVPDTKPADTGVPDTTPADTGVPDTTPADTGVPDTTPADTGTPDVAQDPDLSDAVDTSSDSGNDPGTDVESDGGASGPTLVDVSTADSSSNYTGVPEVYAIEDDGGCSVVFGRNVSRWPAVMVWLFGLFALARTGRLRLPGPRKQ